MSRSPQSRGICSYCGGEFARGGMIRHLKSCSARQAVIKEAGNKPGKMETLVHLRVEGAWQSEYWLDLEVRGAATLDDLDEYLRAIWLECCDHLSRFSKGDWSEDDLPWDQQIGQVFRPGVVLTHDYDFGTTTTSLVKFVSSRQGKATTPHPIALMARNIRPAMECMECGEPAEHFCLECLMEEDIFGTLCEKHAKTHPHDEYGNPVPIVNSPRLGMCGYTGPADPPY